jgi:hypothetical protein
MGRPGAAAPPRWSHLRPGRRHRWGERQPDRREPSGLRRGGRGRLRPRAHLLGGILEFFFQIHDPTTKDRQGEDVGSDYRFEIYTSDDQRQVAEDKIADVDASGLWPSKVAEISEAGTFWEAEAEDQYYLQRHPDGETCHFPRPGWKLPHRETAA